MLFQWQPSPTRIFQVMLPFSPTKFPYAHVRVHQHHRRHSRDHYHVQLLDCLWKSSIKLRTPHSNPREPKLRHTRREKCQALGPPSRYAGGGKNGMLCSYIFFHIYFIHWHYICLHITSRCAMYCLISSKLPPPLLKRNRSRCSVVAVGLQDSWRRGRKLQGTVGDQQRLGLSMEEDSFCKGISHWWLHKEDLWVRRKIEVGNECDPLSVRVAKWCFFRVAKWYPD